MSLELKFSVTGESTTRIELLADKLGNLGVYTTALALRVSELARVNARSKGGRRLWHEIADSVHIARADERGCEIATDHYAARQRHFGGVIRARHKRSLTIPVSELAYGKTVADFSHRRLFVVGHKKKVLGYAENGKFIGLFALVRETRPQRPNHWWPTLDDVTGSAQEAFKEFMGDLAT